MIRAVLALNATSPAAAVKRLDVLAWLVAQVRAGGGVRIASACCRFMWYRFNRYIRYRSVSVDVSGIFGGDVHCEFGNVFGMFGTRSSHRRRAADGVCERVRVRARSGRRTPRLSARCQLSVLPPGC